MKENHKPRLLSDNDPCSISGELENALTQFVNYYTQGHRGNHERYHELLNNLTPAGVYYGREQTILEQRDLIKQNTMVLRRKNYYTHLNN